MEVVKQVDGLAGRVPVVEVGAAVVVGWVVTATVSTCAEVVGAIVAVVGFASVVGGSGSVVAATRVVVGPPFAVVGAASVVSAGLPAWRLTLRRSPSPRW